MAEDEKPRARPHTDAAAAAPTDVLDDAIDPTFRSLADSLTDNLMLLDREGRIRYINYTVPDLSVAQVLGTVAYQYVPEEFRAMIRRCHERVLATAEPDRCETAYVADNGEVSWWEARVSPVVRAGEVVGLVQIGSNVTERRQAAADRDRLFNLSIDMLCVAGTDGYFKRLNPAFEHTLGHTAEELLARPSLEFIHEDDRARTQDAVDRLARGQQMIDFDNRFRCRDGSYRWVSWRTAPDTTGRLMYGIGRDVTERRNLEQQLRHSQKMDAVGQLAGGIAHDFNNLVLAIELNTQFALRSEDPAERRRSLHEVQQAAQRAADLTRQLLAFARRQPATLVAVHLNDIVEGMLAILSRLIPESIEIVFDPSAALQPILADAAQIEQILLNLCVNARDAMPSGGRLTIQTRTGAAGDEGAQVELVVRDTGIGIAPEIRERVFEPFFTTKPQGYGTGLGLSTVYGIVEQHGGRIQVDSEPGSGTVFQIQLPVSTGIPAASLRTPAPAALSGSETILLAEDEPGVRGAVVGLLENAGYRVLIAHNGEEAVELFQRHAAEVALLLFDMVMPRLGGLLAARRIREQAPEIPIVFMSGYSFAADLGVASLAPAGQLQKPFEPDALLRKLREALDG